MKHFKQQSLRIALLSLALLCSVMSAMAHYDFKVDNVYYRIIDMEAMKVSVTNDGNIDGFNGCYSGEVTIPATVNHDNKTYTVCAIQDSAFFLSENMTKITLPEGIETIGIMAFTDCAGITEIIMSHGAHYRA